jgi:hypothetical protein
MGYSPIAKAFTYAGQHNTEKKWKYICWLRTHDPSVRAAEDVHAPDRLVIA